MNDNLKEFPERVIAQVGNPSAHYIREDIAREREEKLINKTKESMLRYAKGSPYVMQSIADIYDEAGLEQLK